MSTAPPSLLEDAFSTDFKYIILEYPVDEELLLLTAGLVECAIRVLTWNSVVVLMFYQK
jgi:hypothetical protein